MVRSASANLRAAPAVEAEAVRNCPCRRPSPSLPERSRVLIPKLLLLKWGVVKYSGVVQKRTNTFFTTRGQKTLVARRGFWSKVSVGNPGVLILHFFVFTKGTLKPRHSNDLTVFVPANSNFSAGNTHIVRCPWRVWHYE
jgi:hypothetical protein